MGVWLWLTNLLQVYKGLFHCSAAGQTAITSHAMFIWCKPCAFGPIIIDWNVVVLHIHLLNQFWLPFEEQFSAGYRHEKSMRSKIKSIIFLGGQKKTEWSGVGKLISVSWSRDKLISCENWSHHTESFTTAVHKFSNNRCQYKVLNDLDCHDFCNQGSLFYLEDRSDKSGNLKEGVKCGHVCKWCPR